MEQEQLERTTSVVGTLERKLVEAKRAKEKMDEVVKELKEELARKWVLSLCTIHIGSAIPMDVLSIFVLFSQIEQAEAKERHEQKVSGLTKELEAAISDWDSLKKKYQEAGEEMERVKSQLVQTQEEWVLCRPSWVFISSISRWIKMHCNRSRNRRH